MKIAYLTSVYARASDTFIRNEVIELRERGHEVSTFSIRREAKDSGVSKEVAAEQSTTDYILEKNWLVLIYGFIKYFFLSPKRFLQSIQLAWHTRIKGVRGTFLQLAYLIQATYLAQRIKTLHIDILHNHIAENSANVAMLTSLLSGVPYSMTVHGPGIFFHPNEFALGEKIARSTFTATITSFCKSQCMLFSQPKDWYKLKIVRCSAGRGFNITTYTAIPDAPQLVFVGRLCHEKGLLILIDAITKIAEQGLPCELKLIGDGPLRSEIEDIIRQRKLEHAIKIFGALGSEEVRTEIERSRALVLPSFAEGLPVVIMEALAVGRPVVTSQIAGIPELVVDRESGWLVTAGSVESLVSALTEAVSLPASRLTDMGQKGATRLKELHNFTTEMDKLEALFKSAIV